jgi:hypothetical protein
MFIKNYKKRHGVRIEMSTCIIVTIMMIKGLTVLLHDCLPVLFEDSHQDQTFSCVAL